MALEEQKQCLDRTPPQGGVGLSAVLFCPLVGVRGAALVSGAPLFFVRIVVTLEKCKFQSHAEAIRVLMELRQRHKSLAGLEGCKPLSEELERQIEEVLEFLSPKKGRGSGSPSANAIVDKSPKTEEGI